MKRFITSALVLICMISSLNLNAQVAYDSVNVVTAGTLGTLLGAKKFTVTNLKISGKLNGTDIKCLREIMTGVYDSSSGATTIGVLRNLDLYYAKIVTGGSSYYENNDGSYYTKTDIIGAFSFIYCSTILSILLPKDIRTIEKSAFWECDKLTSIILSNNVTTIGDYSFWGCESLISINLGNSLTSIGTYAFGGCNSLSSINLGENLTSIGESAFNQCFSLSSLIIPIGLSEIKSGTFYECHSLTSITIPSNIKTIASTAFYRCKGLKVLNIESGLLNIGNNAFCDCTRLSVVNCKSITPPAAGYDGSGLASNSKCKLYIPIGTYYDYWLSLGWGDIPTILEYSESDLLKLTIKQAENAQLTQVVAKGDSLSLIFEPINGWKVNTISFNGIDQTDKLNASNQYITPEITVNSTISVTYISTSIVVPQQNQSNIKVYSNDGTIQLKGVEQGDKINVYNLSGKLVKSVNSFGTETAIEAEKNQIYLIKVAGNTFKVLN